ncbi:MAG TPA: DUF3168 domain-containing protein [Caldilineaceae bacterium]|nr:DUF3168 domain-containing protein [Caldilineaceae bacterium]
MSIEAALWAELTGDAGVSALISTRLYPEHLPQSPTYPAATYRRISTLPVYCRANNGRFQQVRIQIDCYAETYASALALADAITAAMEGWTQASGPRVDRAYVANRQDNFADLLGEDGEIGLYQESVDFFVWFSA